MTLYKNLGRDSGVHSFEIFSDRIIITFLTRATYEYTYRSAGKNNIDAMKFLALKGKGLNSFINNNVKFKYSKKIK